MKPPRPALERRPITGLIPYARNARTHSEAQIAQIAASIREFEFTNPVIVDEAGTIIAGHGRVLAARQLGMTDVPVITVRGWSEAKKRAYVIADNKLALNADWDMAMLSAELQELDTGEIDMALLGFAEGELESILAWRPETEPGNDDKANSVPELAATAFSKTGDLWLLGDHRLLCGDCRVPADVDRVLQGIRVNVAITSPPYAEQRDYDESSGFRPIPPDRYVEWFGPVASGIARTLADDGSFFLNIKPTAEGLDTSLYVFDLVLAHVRRWGWHFATEFCWERQGIPGRVIRRFKNQFEPVYQFTRGEWKFRPEVVRHYSDSVPSGAGPRGERNRPDGFTGTLSSVQGTSQDIGRYIGEGLAYPGNRLPSFTSTHTALGHAAAFPVGLPEFFIRAYSDEGDVTFDPFTGSGSTIIAAQRTDRCARGIELSPLYVDVSVRRWQAFTGKAATLEHDGRSFDEVASARTQAETELA